MQGDLSSGVETDGIKDKEKIKKSNRNCKAIIADRRKNEYKQ